MSINHLSIYIFMAHDFLDSPNIVPRFQKMRGKTIPQRVTACMASRFEKTIDQRLGRPVLIIFEEPVHPVDIESSFFRRNQTVTLEKIFKFCKVISMAVRLALPGRIIRPLNIRFAI